MFALLAAARAVEDRLEASLSALGLSLAKLNVLNRLAEANMPLTLGEIAARLNCVRSNVTQLVDRLEADGLVRREHDAVESFVLVDSVYHHYTVLSYTLQ